MKLFLSSLVCVLSAACVHAASQSSVTLSELVKANSEVTSMIKAFEENRGRKCSAIADDTTFQKKNNKVLSRVTCNKFDNQGEPLADIYFISFYGTVENNAFDLTSVKIVAGE